ncbi:MAG: hypothetical protein MUE40_05795 [Anaerolineae bacterium]|jgi:hypothetical protein|nr:hypothetical protein [Anaerolineae bacterium]
MELVRCVSCNGYGWLEDDFSGVSDDCDWCGGTGYVYRDAAGVDHKIPPADYGQVAATLERLEEERLRELGYTGQAKKPWEQDVRQGTQGGVNPYAAADAPASAGDADGLHPDGG